MSRCDGVKADQQERENQQDPGDGPVRGAKQRDSGQERHAAGSKQPEGRDPAEQAWRDMLQLDTGLIGHAVRVPAARCGYA
jgi:hypothetical protein